MKKDMNRLITQHLDENGWMLDDVSSFGVARSAGGVYTLTLWKTGKSEVKSKRSIKIKIDSVTKHMFLAVEVLEELMAEHAAETTFDKRLKEEDPITTEPIGKPEIFNTPF